MTFSLICWNVNSLEKRIPIILNLFNYFMPDIFCIQEIKSVNYIDIEGYTSYGIGRKFRNGVVIYVKNTFIEKNGNPIFVKIKKGIFRFQIARFIELKFKNFVIYNIYAPSGGNNSTEKTIRFQDCSSYRYKILFLKKLFLKCKYEIGKNNKVFVIGDWNLAPTIKDTHTGLESPVFSKLLTSMYYEFIGLGLKDVSLFFQEEIKNVNSNNKNVFTYMSYRNMYETFRIDYLLTNAFILDFKILKEIRQLKNTSDHIPLLYKCSV